MKQVPVILFGAGGVGRALIDQLIDGRYTIAERNQIQFNLVAIADSRSWLWQIDGLSTGQLRDVLLTKKNGRSLPNTDRPTNLEIIEYAADNGLAHVVVVDVTAVDGMEPVIDRALALEYGVVLANKKALAGPWSSAQHYFNHPRIRHESTVGGGQPVIATLRYLLDVGDPIYEITGQLSGTLGYICTQLDLGIPFSQAVTAAHANGFTEPDPREDLSGKDVMRKIMILGRMAGWPLEPEHIAVESLYSDELASLSVPDFMSQTDKLDEATQARVAAANANGHVLRYIADLREGSGAVGLRALPAGSPLANLKYISFRTQRYNDEPLIICGKGAGVEMTASGVLGDMIDLVRETHPRE